MENLSSWIRTIVGTCTGCVLGIIFICPLFEKPQPQIETCKTDTTFVCKSFFPYQVTSTDSGKTLFSADSIAYFESIDTVDMWWLLFRAVHGGVSYQILDTLYVPRIYITHDGNRFRVRAEPCDQIEVIL